MDWLEQVVAARVRDWERRVAEGTAPPPPEAAALAPGLEVQLWQEVVALRSVVGASEPGPEREALLARSRDRELQLWILLERSGRPLAAARLQATLATLPR